MFRYTKFHSLCFETKLHSIQIDIQNFHSFCFENKLHSIQIDNILQHSLFIFNFFFPNLEQFTL